MFWWTVGAFAAPCALEVADGRVPDPGLAFVTRTATLAEGASGGVEALACLLGASPALRLHVEVHTDSMGADVYNLAMSQRRADAVRDALLARGIEGGRVSASGCGEQYPVAPNDTAEGRARNSRIEVWAPAPPDRPACPVVEVPPAAPTPPPPPPAIPPPRVPTDCAAWLALSPARAPTWPGVRCEAGPAGWTCALPATPAVAVTAVSACLTGQWDGSDWLAAREGWALVIGPGAAGESTLGAR